MTHSETSKSSPRDAIIVDEIGLESGRYGIYRLRCLYQPVFRRQGTDLSMTSVAGEVRPFVGAEETPWSLFMSAVAQEDRNFVDQIALLLQLRNHASIEMEDPTEEIGLELLLDVASPETGPESLLERINLLTAEMAEAEVDPALVFCSITGAAAGSVEQLERVVEAVRAHGMRMGIADFGMGRWTDEQMAVLAPEIVRIDGDWFSNVCRDSITIRLFDAVMERLRDGRARVLVSGIRTPQQFGVALRAGVDLFQGDHLAAPVHVGHAMPETISLRSRLGSEKLVSLYG